MKEKRRGMTGKRGQKKGKGKGMGGLALNLSFIERKERENNGGKQRKEEKGEDGQQPFVTLLPNKLGKKK